jgi:hypothetical protein
MSLYYNMAKYQVGWVVGAQACPCPDQFAVPAVLSLPIVCGTMHEKITEADNSDKKGKGSMEKTSSSKTVGDTIYSIGTDGKLTILAAGQQAVIHEPGEALELLQWLYANRDLMLKARYPAGTPQWAQEGKTSGQDTDPQGLQHALEQRQQEH